MSKNVLYLRGVRTEQLLEDEDTRIQPKDLSDESLQIDEAFLDELEFVFDSDSVSLSFDGNDVFSYDLTVFQRVARMYRVAYPAAVLLQHADKKFVNSGILNYAGIDKLSQYAVFHTIGVPFPKTFFGSAETIRSESSKHFPYPFIVKGILSSGGRKNDLIRDEAQLRKLEIDDDPEVGDAVAQQFIPNDGDYRLLFIGNELIVLHRKAVEGSHLNNTSAGADATIVPEIELSSEIIEQARQIQRRFGFEICGIDVVLDKHTGEHFFLEINSQPQVYTGAYTGQKIEKLLHFLKQS